MPFKAIIAKVPNFDALIEELKKDVNDEVSDIDAKYAKTYRTWEHKPDFKIKKASIEGDRIVGSTAIYQGPSRDNPYQFIEKGTKVRYATMTPGFRAKTSVRVIGSGTGAGGLLYVSKRRPRPGIKAREFTEVIQEEEQPKFEAKVKETFKRFSIRQ